MLGLLVSCGEAQNSGAPKKGNKLDAIEGADGTATGQTTGETTGETGGETTGGETTGGETTGGETTGGETTGGETTGSVEEPWPPFEPEEKQLLWPCDSNDDCDSGWCINTAHGKVCTEFCVDECTLQTWTCAQITQTGTDVVYICVPKFSRLCDPCSTNEDCLEYDDLAGNVCINYGPKGSFCGVACDTTEDCPGGYSCQTLPGEDSAQCIPVDGAGAPSECKCSKLAKDLGKSTSCFDSNEYGTCYGFRECAPGGLTECSSDSPKVEICNGQDDNCDNQVDNITIPEPCNVTNQFGSCVGVLACNPGLGTGTCNAKTPENEICDGIDQNCDGIADDPFADTDGDFQADCVDEDDDNDTILDAQDNCPFDANPLQENNEGDELGDVCDPDDDNDGHPDVNDCDPFDAAINGGTPEVCDGKDNDCDGGVDEDLCDDGNMCTDDKCNTDGSCTNAPNSIACDDQSVCTQQDVCKEGKCAGLNPINCDDGNQCTNDNCEPAAGCTHQNNAAACEDGSKCTKNDACFNGSCKSGPPIDCDDGNPCTQNQGCSPATGCAPSVNINGGCKVSNHPACGFGTCMGGVCQPQGGGQCDDDDACTTNDYCAGGKCNGGQEYDCNQQCKSQGPFCISLGTCVEAFGSPTCAAGCFCP